MLTLQMRTSLVTRQALDKFSNLYANVPKGFRPLLQPTLLSQARILGLSMDSLKTRAPRPEYDAPIRRLPIKAELFTDGKALYAVILASQDPRRRTERRPVAPASEDSGKADYVLQLSYVGPDINSKGLAKLESIINAVLDTNLQPHHYRSAEFTELQAEGRTCPKPSALEEIKAAHLLSDRTARTLATSIKASGGLLVCDLAKQLPTGERERIPDIQKALASAKLINSEIVVVCTTTQTQILRVASRKALDQLARKGIKCSCGRSINNERIEEAVTITEFGRTMLDGSRWLTHLVLQELDRAGIPNDRTLIEQQAGGDELDILAEISGELVLFELKDKEFNLGNAYSFGAKIGIIRPNHPVIISTGYVGNDAKEHFQRAGLAGSRRYGDRHAEDTPVVIRYIEGLANLRVGIQQLASDICSGDAARILDQVLSMASLDPEPLIETIRVPGLRQKNPPPAE